AAGREGEQQGEGERGAQRGQGGGEGQGEGQGEGEDQQQTQREGREQAARQRPQPPSPGSERLARLLLWLLAAAAAVAVIVYTVIHRQRILAWLRGLGALPAMMGAALARLWERLRRLLGGLGLRIRRPRAPGELPADPFVDIFARGLADDLQPSQVVDYVYRAFQVYMARQGFERGDDQTALEFLRLLPRHVLLPERAAEKLTRAYVLASYSPREVTDSQVQGARETWRLMRDALAQAPRG
ncbi:MAG TPA: DUF4129 domain-containing protein, partial [Armatimonadota bacterium]|nr:DUF4129 domain-containing protein [Armatimonadota bacterium]